MKKLSLTLAALATASCAVFAASSVPNALYVVKDGVYQKFNFGVAGDLLFSNEGKTLTIKGYDQQIDLDKIDYITFEAPLSKSLTPSQQKDHLLQTGHKFASMIDLNRNADLIKMCYTFFTCEDNDYDHKHAPSYYEVPEEYWNFDKEVRKMAKSFGSLAKGNPMGVRALAPSAVNLNKMSDYFGIYVANEKSEVWEKISDADYFEIRFNSDDNDLYTLRITKSDKVTRYNSADFDFEMPETIDIVLAHGSKTLATGSVVTTAVQDKSINFRVSSDANGYVAQSDINILDDGITTTTSFKIDNTQMVNVTGNVSGKHLLHYDEMKDDIKESTHYHDEDDNCCGEDPERLLAHFIKATTEGDILGELQVKGIVYNPLKVYNDLKDEVDSSSSYVNIDGKEIYTRGKLISTSADKSIVDVVEPYSDSKETVAKVCQYLNNYSDATFFYDGKKDMQGFLGFEVKEDTDEYSPWSESKYTIYADYLCYVYSDDKGYYIDAYTLDEYDERDSWVPIYIAESEVFTPVRINEYWYEVTPLLYFPDLTSFDFEEFFDDGTFNDLTNDVEDIFDTYMSITGQDEED